MPCKSGIYAVFAESMVKSSADSAIFLRVAESKADSAIFI